MVICVLKGHEMQENVSCISRVLFSWLMMMGHGGTETRCVQFSTAKKTQWSKVPSEMVLWVFG